jgi:toxin ParE1/3/4
MILFTSEALSDVERVRNFIGDDGQARRALAAIWTATERLEDFPNLGRPTDDPDIRQIVVPFAGTAYIVRYSVLTVGTLLVVRIWHGREARDRR